jgi:CBS domain-containing protein
MDSLLIAPTRECPSLGMPQYSFHEEVSALHPDDSAYRAVTDFESVSPFTVSADCSIEAALNDMTRLGVHALLVTSDEENSEDHHFAGLITSHEIHHMRSRLLHLSTDSTGYERVLCVRDAMTPLDDLPLVKYASLRDVTALELYEMFQGTGLTHLLVIDRHGGKAAIARGLVSRAHLAKRLGLSL